MSPARCALVTVALTLTSLHAAEAKTVTVCGQKADYEPMTTSTGDQSHELTGIWVGDLLAENVAYSVNYRRCVGFAIEGIRPDGKVVATYIAGDSAKNMHNGTSFGAKPVVARWQGTINGNLLRLESEDRKVFCEFQLPASPKLQGRYSGSLGNGRISLVKQ